MIISVVVLGFISVFASVIQEFLLFISFGTNGATMPLFLLALIILHSVFLLTAVVFYFPNPSKKLALTILIVGLLSYVYPIFTAIFQIHPSKDMMKFFLLLVVLGLIPLVIVILQVRTIVSTLRDDHRIKTA